MMNRTGKAAAWILGTLYAFCMVFGYQARFFGEIRFKSIKTYLALLVLVFVASFFFKTVWELMEERMMRRMAASKGEKTKQAPMWPISTAIIWLLNFITFLGVYPGFFVYDAQEELNETILRSFNPHHPIFHVLSLGGIIQGVHKLTGDYNIAIASFIIFQMTVIAVLLGWIVSRMHKKGTGIIVSVLLSVYFGVFPVIVMYSLCSSKDGLYGAFMLAFMVLCADYLKDPSKFSLKGSDKRPMIFFVAFSVLMMLYRNNGIYALLVFGAIAVFILYKYDRNESKFIYTLLIAALIYGILNRGLLLATGAGPDEKKEMLTVPIQQMARIYCYDNASLSDEEKQTLESYVPKDALMRYNPKCSDLVKIDFNEEHYKEDKLSFYKLYLKLFVKHPAAYLNAWVMTSYGLWYPNAVIDGYTGNTVYTFTYKDSSYFGYETEPPGERRSFIPVIDRFYRWLSLDPSIQKMPFLSLLFAPGAILWIYLFFIGYLIHIKRKDVLMPYLLPLLSVVTCIIGPMSLVRYSWYLWVALPMITLSVLSLQRGVSDFD